MTNVIDLPAVARVRTALRATVTKHPELCSPEASERLANWLHTLEENDTVAPRLDPNNATSIPLAVRLTQRLADALDAEVNRLRAMHPGLTFTRSDVARAALLQRFCPEATAPVATPPAVLEASAPKVQHAPPEVLEVPAQVERAPSPPMPMVPAPQLALVMPQAPEVPTAAVLEDQHAASSPDLEASAPSTDDEQADLRALFVASVENDKTSFRKAAEATGWNKDSINRWSKGTIKSITPERAAALRAHLEALQ